MVGQISTHHVSTRIQFGIGASSTVGQEVRSLGGRHPLILTDKGVVGAGLLEGIRKSLAEAGVGVTVFDEVHANPRTADVNRAAEAYRGDGCDSLIALGGGSVMDCTKATGIAVAHGGRIEEYAPMGPKPVEKQIPPFIAIPTTSGTGSEVSLGAVITDTERRVKNTFFLRTSADVAILDPELTRTLPPALTASTGVDALSHGIERFTSPQATPLSDAIALACIKLAAANLRQAYAYGDNMEARSNMMWASMMGGMPRSGTSTSHFIGVPMAGCYEMTHGVAIGILLPHVTEFNLIANPAKYAQVAEAMGERIEGLSILDAARKSVDAIKRVLVDVGITQRFRDFGIPEEEIPALVEVVMKIRGAALKKNNPRQMGASEVEAIIRRCY